jgi:signal transduction histidine kinase
MNELDVRQELATKAPDEAAPSAKTVAGAVSIERMLDVCEEQRRHIARELHDELGQRLSSAKWLLAEISAAAAKDAALASRLDELRGALDDTIGSMRRIASDLRPPLLDDLGLNAAIESLARSTAERLGIEGLDHTVCYQSRVTPQKWISPSTEDELERTEKEIQKLTDKQVEVIDKHVSTKEAELMTV